jgi:hypothetical protein
MKSYIKLLIAAVWLMPGFGFGASREVVVYSFATEVGQKVVRPSRESPSRCLIGSGGYHEWGGIRAGEKPFKVGQIDPLLRAALRVNAYEALRVGEIADIVVVYQWGCLRPDASGISNKRFDVVVNQLDLLDLVGGRVLATTNDRILRTALIDAASEERYFLIVSAFEPSSYAQRTNTLLWRTQCSVPIPGITQEQAFPVLVAAGAAFFGRETPLPRFIAIDVERELRAANQAAPP